MANNEFARLKNVTKMVKEIISSLRKKIFFGKDISVEKIVQRTKSIGGRVYRFGKSPIINTISIPMESIHSKELMRYKPNGEVLQLSFKNIDSNGSYEKNSGKLIIYFDQMPQGEEWLDFLYDRYDTLIHEFTHFVQNRLGQLPRIPEAKSKFNYLSWGWETNAKIIQMATKYYNSARLDRIKVDRLQKNNNLSNEEKKEILGSLIPDELKTFQGWFNFLWEKFYGDEYLLDNGSNEKLLRGFKNKIMQKLHQMWVKIVDIYLTN